MRKFIQGGANSSLYASSESHFSLPCDAAQIIGVVAAAAVVQRRGGVVAAMVPFK